MSYYEHSDSYGHYGSESRRNSNSFSDELNGAKRKKTKWSGRGRGGNRRSFSRGGGRNVNRSSSPLSNAPIDIPLFKEPLPMKRTPPPIRRTPTPKIEQRKRGRERINSYRSNYHEPPSPQPYFEMRDMPEFVEPQHSGASWHWENYVNGCKSWQEKHKLAYYRSRCLALEFENNMLFEQINQLIEEHYVFAHERGRTPTMRVPDLSNRSGAQDNRSSDTKKQEKEKLDKQRSEREKTRTAVRKTGSEEKNGGPKVPMGQKRKEELEQLYGKNGSVIHGLETSLQLNFTRNCDSFKPEMYPTDPINAKAVVA